jgi:hypothetical protein
MPAGTMKTEYIEQNIQTIRTRKLTELNKSTQNTQQYVQRLKKKLEVN